MVIFGLSKKAYEIYQRKQYLASLTDTASPNVQTLKDTAYIDYLDARRTLWVYLPPGYEQDTTRYPVIYFMDGNALFSDVVLEGPEWQVDEVMDSVAAKGGPKAIVIGIDNSEERMTEYKPFLSPIFPEEKEVTGDQHAEWIASDLKAWVDRTYRTKPEAEYTTIGGASLGGIMAYYMVTTFPDVFGNAIVFSPSFWVNEKVFELHKQVPDLNTLKIYMNVGEDEYDSMINNAKKVYDILTTAGVNPHNLRFDIEKNEGHSHSNWRKGFKKAYPWIVER